MITKQTVAVIGASRKMGREITQKLAKGNYKLLLYYNEPGSLDELVSGIQQSHPGADVEAIECSVDACWEGDFIILDLPADTEMEVAEKIRDVANQKIVISMDHSFYDSDRTRFSEKPDSGAEMLQQLLPNSKLVKVFNTSFGHNGASQLAASQNTVTLLAGNDKEALKTVFGLFSIAGLEPVVAGDLRMSRTLEQLV